MNKRDTFKGMAAGALAVWASGIGVGKSAFAAEADLRNEILNHDNLSIDLHRANIETKDGHIWQTVRVYKWKGVSHVQHTNVTFDKDYNRVVEHSDAVTDHETIEEAYLYAKQLKEKYYG